MMKRINQRHNIGDSVLSLDGTEIGTIKEVRNDNKKIAYLVEYTEGDTIEYTGIEIEVRKLMLFNKTNV